MTDSIPSIVIIKSESLTSPAAEEKVCRGIEEEGVPFEVRTDPGDSAVKLAYQAAMLSRLDIGIGIGADHNIAVHYSRLEEVEPLFTASSDSESRSHVILGLNAARFAKGLPLKEL